MTGLDGSRSLHVAASPRHAGRRGRLAGVRARLAARRATLAVLLVLAAPLAGCYRYVPIESAEPGLRVALELNDRGRAELADSIGPTVRTIEGTIVSADQERFQLQVHAVRQFSGQSYAWSGEPLRVPRDFVSQSRERRFDKTRSWLVGIGVVAAVAIVAASVDLFGSGGLLTDSSPPPPIGQQ